MTHDRYAGCLLGLALGDAGGAPYEGGFIERLLWRLIGKTRRGEDRWTDDTQMALDLAESLLECGRLDQDALARRFAAGYRWSRGYGPGAARLLRRIARGHDWRQANRSVYREGSYGNGAAMRAPVVGLYFAHRPDELAGAARASAEITHAHPLAIEGAVLLARAAALALHDVSSAALVEQAGSHCAQDAFTSRLAQARQWLVDDASPEPAEVVRTLGHGIAAAESCVTALYLAARFLGQSFDSLLAFAIRCGGDTDTIAAMAGAVWGASAGAARLPAARLDRLEQRERIAQVAAALFEAGASGR